MLKKWCALVIVLVVLLCGCTPNSRTVTEIPDGAVHVQSLGINIGGGAGVLGGGLMLGELEDDCVGYFVLQVQYESGSAKNIEWSMSSPTRERIIAFAQGNPSAIYVSETVRFALGSEYEISFGSVKDYYATYEVYFVPTVGDGE